MRFSTLSAFGLLGFALIAECNPVDLKAIEADNHPAVIEPIAKSPLRARAAPSCPLRKSSKNKNKDTKKGTKDTKKGTKDAKKDTTKDKKKKVTREAGIEMLSVLK
jgi:hypothetical protein